MTTKTTMQIAILQRDRLGRDEVKVKKIKARPAHLNGGQLAYARKLAWVYSERLMAYEWQGEWYLRGHGLQRVRDYNRKIHVPGMRGAYREWCAVDCLDE